MFFSPRRKEERQQPAPTPIAEAVGPPEVEAKMVEAAREISEALEAFEAASARLGSHLGGSLGFRTFASASAASLLRETTVLVSGRSHDFIRELKSYRPAPPQPKPPVREAVTRIYVLDHFIKW